MQAGCSAITVVGMKNKLLLLIPVLMLSACTTQPGATTPGGTATGSADPSISADASAPTTTDDGSEAGDQKSQRQDIRDGKPGRPDGADSDEVNGLKAEDVLVPTPRGTQGRVFGAIVNSSDKERKLVEIKASSGLSITLAQDDHDGRGHHDGPGRHGEGRGPGDERPAPPSGQGEQGDRPEPPGGQGGQGEQGDRPEPPGGQGERGEQGDRPEPPRDHEQPRDNGQPGGNGQRPEPKHTVVEQLTVPANGTLELHPREAFGLIEDAQHALKTGEKVSLEFIFDDGTTLKVEPTVSEFTGGKGRGSDHGGRGPGHGGRGPGQGERGPGHDGRDGERAPRGNRDGQHARGEMGQSRDRQASPEGTSASSAVPSPSEQIS